MPSKTHFWAEPIEVRARSSECFSNITQMGTPKLKRKYFYQIVRWAKVTRRLITTIQRTASLKSQIKMWHNSIRSMYYHDSSRPKAYKDLSWKPKNRGIWLLINLETIVSCLPSRLIWYHQPEKYSKLMRPSHPKYSQTKPTSVRWACLGFLIPIIRTSKISNLMKSHLYIAQMKPTSPTRTQFSPSLGSSSLIFLVFRPLVKFTSMRIICGHRD